MVTASHNPEPDNGVKLIDPDGSMFPVELGGQGAGGSCCARITAPSISPSWQLTVICSSPAPMRRGPRNSRGVGREA